MRHKLSPGCMGLRSLRWGPARCYLTSLSTLDLNRKYAKYSNFDDKNDANDFNTDTDIALTAQIRAQILSLLVSHNDRWGTASTASTDRTSLLWKCLELKYVRFHRQGLAFTWLLKRKILSAVIVLASEQHESHATTVATSTADHHSVPWKIHDSPQCLSSCLCIYIGFLIWRLLLWELINLKYLDLLVSSRSCLTGWSSLVASLTVTNWQWLNPPLHIPNCGQQNRFFYCLMVSRWCSCQKCLNRVLWKYSPG